MRDLRAELRSKPSAYPEVWRPEPGDVLVGRLLRVECVQTAQGSAQVAVVQDDESGEERSVWLTATTLRAQWEAHAPEVGARLGIARDEDGLSARGREYRRFRLVVDAA